MKFFFAGFKLLMKLTLGMYFKKISIEGLDRVPRGVPLLVTPNHQNAFIDALLVGAFIPVHIYSLARSDIFNWWSTSLLRLLNMIPIYRIRDGYSALSRNDEVFEQCRVLFSERKSLLIFPEGNHGEHHYLRPLTKGAARLALSSQIEVSENIHIQPVGLNYFDHQAARSKVLLAFGDPIPVREYIELYEDNNAKGLIALRNSISNGMKDLLAIPEQTEDYEFRKKSIFNANNEEHSLQELKEVKPGEIKTTTFNRKGRIARILNPLPFLIIHQVISKVEDVVFHSSLKFAIGLFVFPIWWLLVFVGLYFFLGFHIALLSVFVMIVGLFYSYQ